MKVDIYPEIESAECVTVSAKQGIKLFEFLEATQDEDQQYKVSSYSVWEGNKILGTELPQLEVVGEFILDTDVESILNNYTVFQEQEVFSFISRHREIEALVKEAPLHIRRQFGTCSLHLKLTADSYDESKDVLWIYIVTPRDIKTSFGNLKELRNSWWRKASRTVSDNLKIDIELSHV